VTPSACSLRGKLLNVRDATVGKVADNEEITNVKKILGLESGKTYAGLDDLRGRVLILADQDVDGSHIKGLLLRLLVSVAASLLPGRFISSMAAHRQGAWQGGDQPT
jgi:DNA topoisomerase-2